MGEIKLGNQAQDNVTGVKGTVTAIAHYLHGVDRVQITPRINDNGKLIEAIWADRPQVSVV